MEELTKRVIGQIKKGEHKEYVVTALGLSLRGVYSIQRMHMETDGISKGKKSGRPRSGHSDDLIEAVDNKIQMVEAD